MKVISRRNSENVGADTQNLNIGSVDYLAEIDRFVTVGICCMEKKMNSKPMQSIINNLSLYKDLKLI